MILSLKPLWTVTNHDATVIYPSFTNINHHSFPKAPFWDTLATIHHATFSAQAHTSSHRNCAWNNCADTSGLPWEVGQRGEPALVVPKSPRHWLIANDNELFKLIDG